MEAPGAPQPGGAGSSTGVGSVHAWVSRSYDKPHMPAVPQGLQGCSHCRPT